MKKLLLLLIISLSYGLAKAQSVCNCNPQIKSWRTCFEQNHTISIGICCRSEVSLGMQGFSSSVLNKTADDLEIEFDFIVQLNCGKTVTEHVHLYKVKGWEKVSGERFSGDLDLAHDYFSDDCKANPIIKTDGIKVINLKINNLTKELQVKEMEERKEKEALALKERQEQEEADKAALAASKKEEEARKKEEQAKEKEEADAAKLAQEKKAAEEEEAAKNAAAAERQRYADSVKAAEENRTARLERAAQKDKEENLQAVAITGAVAGVMLSDNLRIEKIEGRSTYFRAQAYIGGFNIPQVENISDGRNFHYSSLSSQFTYGGGAAIDAWLFNNQKIGLLLQPFINYGIDMGSGTSSTFLSYGGNVRLQAGAGIKLFAEAGYRLLSGSYESDNDAVNSSLGIYTNDGITTTAAFDYSSYRYGGGLMIDAFAKENRGMDIGLKLGAYLDNPMTPNWNKTYKTPLLYELQFVAKGGFFVRGEYSTGYPIAGNALYSIDEPADGQYWTVHVGKIFNLTH